MSLVHAAAGFLAGFFVGIGATLFYLKWKMGRQMNRMQQQMEDVMDMTGEMEDAFGGLEDLEEADFEEKEEKEDRN